MMPRVGGFGYQPERCTLRASRGLTLTILASLATGWAAAMVMAGLWFLVVATGRWRELSGPLGVFGITVIAGGQYVFMVLVANRVFPLAARRPFVWWLEIFTLVAFLLGLTWFVLHYGGAWL